MKNTIKSSQGFTLLELLISIAILGILVGILLVIVGPAKSSANDSKIKSALESLRKEAEIFLNDADLGNGRYFIGNGQVIPGVNSGNPISSGIPATDSASISNCSVASTFTPTTATPLKASFLGQYMESNGLSLSRGWTLIQQAITALGGNASLTRCYMRITQPGWFVVAQLTSVPNAAWCVDSVGNSRQVSMPTNIAALAGSMLPGGGGNYTCPAS